MVARYRHSATYQFSALDILTAHPLDAYADSKRAAIIEKQWLDRYTKLRTAKATDRENASVASSPDVSDPETFLNDGFRFHGRYMIECKYAFFVIRPLGNAVILLLPKGVGITVLCPVCVRRL